MLSKIVLKPQNYSRFKSFLFFIFIVFGTNINQILCYTKNNNDFWKPIAQVFKYLGFFSIWYLINSIYISTGYEFKNLISFMYLIFIVLGTSSEYIFCSNNDCSGIWKAIFVFFKRIGLSVIWSLINSIYLYIKNNYNSDNKNANTNITNSNDSNSKTKWSSKFILKPEDYTSNKSFALTMIVNALFLRYDGCYIPAESVCDIKNLLLNLTSFSIVWYSFHSLMISLKYGKYRKSKNCSKLLDDLYII